MTRRVSVALAAGIVLCPLIVISAQTPPSPGLTNLREFFPLAHAQYFGDAEMTILNNAPEPVSVAFRWLVRQQGYVAGTPIVAEPTTPKFLPLRDLLPNGVSLSALDGLEIAYQGRAVMHVSAQITLRPIEGHVPNQSLDVPPTIPVDVRGPRLEAVWATPRHDEQAVVEIVNLSGGRRSIVVSRAGETQHVDLDSDSAQVLTLTSAASRDLDWIRIEGDQPGFRAAGFVMSAADRVPHVIRFYDPKAAARSDVWANGIRLGDPSLGVLLKNTTDVAIRAKADFLDLKDGSVIADLGALDLAPGSGGQVDLGPLRRANLATRTATLRVNSFSSSGSLVGSVQTVDAATGLQFDAPLRDSAWDNTSYRRGTGNCAWRIDDDYETRVTLTNVGDSDTGYLVVFRANQIQYIGGTGRLGVGASTTFDLRYIRDQQIKDTARRTLPAAADRGQCHWSITSLPGQSASNSRLMGRAEVVSVSRRVSSTHSW